MHIKRYFNNSGIMSRGGCETAEKVLKFVDGNGYIMVSSKIKDFFILIIIGLCLKKNPREV